MKKRSIVMASVLAAICVILAACNSSVLGGTPQIALFDTTSGKVAVHPGDPAIKFGAAKYFPSTPQTHHFSVENSGTVNLTLEGTGARIVVTGDTGYFSVPTQPPATVPAGGSVSFDVVLAANAGSLGVTTRNATIGIASNDPNLANLSFNVTGTDQYS